MKKEPIVMCLTNTVAANFTANVLLAIGAKPAMMSEPSEAAELAVKSDAVLINLGTVDASQAEAMLATLRAISEGTVPAKMGTVPAQQTKVPWVLDPVAIHLLSYRQQLLRDFLSLSFPTAIRGNLTEINYILRNFPFLMGTVPMLGTGEVDQIWGTVPRKTGTVPGNGDSPQGKMGTVPGGVEMLTRVTATGCAQGAMVAAMIGGGQSPEEACYSASRLMKRAGEVAWSRAKAPGSFKVALVDALWELT